ncbi:hypothetical protein [Pseudofrankia asymbiotica]|uniref:hypothetical protein n=1 Tax=Pseudofrankia asymbiotica TaxID=1834516 RepID=UPI0010560B4E|nr:hypothetical protein [Pseudofrankia asymbiotica]
MTTRPVRREGPGAKAAGERRRAARVRLGPVTGGREAVPRHGRVLPDAGRVGMRAMRAGRSGAPGGSRIVGPGRENAARGRR